MGAEGNKNLPSSDAETLFLSSRRDLIAKVSGPSPDQDSKEHHDLHHRDENVTINIPRSLKPIKIKVDSPPSADHHRIPDVVDHENDDSSGGAEAPKTPTGEQHRIPPNPTCPPAPRKQARPLKRRRTLFNNSEGGTHVQRPMRLVELSHEEIDLLFPRPTSTTNSRDIQDHHLHHRPGNIKKVNKANLTTLMSFR